MGYRLVPPPYDNPGLSGSAIRTLHRMWGIATPPRWTLPDAAWQACGPAEDRSAILIHRLAVPDDEARLAMAELAQGEWR